MSAEHNDNTSQARVLPSRPGPACFNKENEISGFPGFTQDECIEWDEDTNFDLRQVAGSPFVPQRRPTISGKASRQPFSDVLHEVRPNHDESKKSNEVVTNESKKKLSKESTIEKGNKQQGRHRNCLQLNDSEALTQVHGNLQSKSGAAKPPVVGRRGPKNFLATGVRFRKKRKSVDGLQSNDPKRPHSADSTTLAGKVRRRPRSAGSAGFYASTMKTAMGTQAVCSRTSLVTDPIPKTSDIEELPKAVITHPNGMNEHETSRSCNLISSNTSNLSNLTTNSSMSRSHHEMPPPANVSFVHVRDINQNAEMHTGIPKAQQLKSQTQNDHSSSHCYNAIPSSFAPPELQRVAHPSNHPNVPERNSQQMVDSKQEEKKAVVEDEFGGLPEFSDADFAAMDALVQNATQSTQPCVDVASNARDAETSNCSEALAAQVGTKYSINDPGIRNNMHEPLASSSTGDDIYGDFPDFDFDAIDKQIAARSAPTCRKSGVDTKDFRVLSSDEKAMISQVKTAEKVSAAEKSKSGVSYATFTRYKVVRVENDTSSFTKSLSVARWKDTMNTVDDKSIHSSSYDQNSGVLMLPPKNSSNQETATGEVLLKGEWYYTEIDAGDIVHICSLSGSYRTDVDSSPIVLQSTPQGSDFEDDLVLVVHPDVLVTPSVISETINCSRRAVLRSRIGSSGKMGRAALIGTMRHGLFERCMGSSDFSRESAMKFSRGIVRNFGDSLVGCGISDAEAEAEVVRILPQLQAFAKTYTSLGDTASSTTEQVQQTKGNIDRCPSGSKLKGHGAQVDINFIARSVHATEETAVSPELGLKGDIDVTVHAETQALPHYTIGQPGKDAKSLIKQSSLMGIELKTGHNQNPQNAHMAQLSMYTLMLRMRYGSSASENPLVKNAEQSLPSNDATVCGSNGGMLLYLNHESHRAVLVSPMLRELKSLIVQRNVAAREMKRASQPRGIVLSYETKSDACEGTISPSGCRQSVTLAPPPPAALPRVLSKAGSCSRCYTNRECMMYAKAEKPSANSQWRAIDIDSSHGELVKHFTGHLNEDDVAYFRKWDRLVDLEADACTHSPAEAWLMNSADRERTSGKCMSSLIFDDLGSRMINAAMPGSSRENLAGFVHSTALIKLTRAPNTDLITPLCSLKIEKGNYVIGSTDSTSSSLMSSYLSISGQLRKLSQPRVFRHQLYVLRGTVEYVDESSVHIRSSLGELEKIRKLASNFTEEKHCLSASSDEKNWVAVDNRALRFRLDKDEVSTGTGTLRQNLINVFTGDADQFLLEKGKRSAPGDKAIQSSDECSNNPLRRRMSWLRDTVVRLRPPAFNPSLAKSMFDGMPAALSRDLRSEFSSLNPDQRNAVKTVMCAQDYSLIQGFPGSGKTSTISFVSRLLAARGKRVLVSSFTHAAVDNLMMKLMEKGMHSSNSDSLPGLVRLGQKSKCHPGVHSIMVETAASARDRLVRNLEHEQSNSVQELPSVESLRHAVTSACIVGVTALSIPRTSLLDGQHFDIVIVDEAGQISQPAILGALMAADSFVLVGDHLQLPPLVVSSVAEAGGYGTSMLKRLADSFPDKVAQLTLQYRMNDEICSLCNEIVYKGKLQCANNDVLSRRLSLPRFSSTFPNIKSTQFSRGWLAKVIDPLRPVVFVNTDAIELVHSSTDQVHLVKGANNTSSIFKGLEKTLGVRAGGSIVNDTEVELVRYIVHALTSCGLSESSVGVISPFRAQLRLFDDCPSFVGWKSSGLEVSTIDRFQGRDKPLIILSLVRSNAQGKSGRLLEDFRRLNVAISRAKMKLIMVGSFDTLHKGSTVLKPALESLRQRSLVETLPGNALDVYKL